MRFLERPAGRSRATGHFVGYLRGAPLRSPLDLSFSFASEQVTKCSPARPGSIH
jgi:hypothetical protein